MSNVPDGTDSDNPPAWLLEDVPVADEPAGEATWPTGSQTIEVEELVAEPRAAFDLETIRATAPPIVRRAIDRLVRGTFDPAAAGELRELAGALKIPGLEVIIDRGVAEWERLHPPRKGRNGHANGKRDTKPAKAEPQSPEEILKGSLWSDAVDALVAWGRLPAAPIFVPTVERGGQEIVRLKPGGIIVLIGGTGAGKTTLAIEIMACHAQWTGPAAFFGLELDVEETVARRVGQHHGVGWIDAGTVSREAMAAALDLPRAHVFGRMSMAEVEARFAALRSLYGDEPILVVIDYAQILEDDITERLRFAVVLERLRAAIKRHRVIAILTSQTSRGGTAALKTGEKLGADTTDTGAESAQLERMAYVTLALGEQGDDDGHGWRTIDLNVGKVRMGGGDIVVPMKSHGLSGRFAHAGEPVKASDLRAQRSAAKAETERKRSDERAEERVRAYLQTVEGPVAQRRVEDGAGGKARLAREALQRMIATGEVVEVGFGSRANYRPPVMLAAKRSQAVPERSQAVPSAGDRSHSVAVPGPYVVGPGPLDRGVERTRSKRASEPWDRDRSDDEGDGWGE